MSVSNEITRLIEGRNTIRTKLVGWGLSQSTDTLDELATSIYNIASNGSPSVTVQVGDSYTISPGYYTGGTVTGIAGEGQYTLQQKTVTPTKSQQVIQPDIGYYGLSQVTIGAIPNNYADISSVTTSASDVLATKVFVNSSGVLTAGTMTNNGAVSATIDTVTTSYTIPSGYHNGSGTVSLTTETKTAIPSDSSQEITPTSGKVLSKVTVNAIPDRYIDSFNVDESDPSKILEGTVVGMYDEVHIAGIVIEGTMPNNGAVGSTILSTATTVKNLSAGYYSEAGSVSIVLETKNVTPTESSQTITPTSGKVLSQVTVSRIPTKYMDATGKTVTAASLLSGITAIGISNGTAISITGTMPNNGSISGTITGLGTVVGDTSYTIPAGYTSGGTISLTNDIETQLAAI